MLGRNEEEGIVIWESGKGERIVIVKDGELRGK